MFLQSSSVDQSGSTAHGDNVGGNKTTYNTSNYSFGSTSTSGTTSYSALEKWVEQLRAACESDATITHNVRNFDYYARKRMSLDGIDGLIKKLEAGGRSARIEKAIERKVDFEKLLEEWSYYASAQEIFAYLLAQIERKFELTVEIHLDKLPPNELDLHVDEHVLFPIVHECAKIPQFDVNLNTALGMLYWLAEQCFVRWHK